jgi:hypothetical protein
LRVAESEAAVYRVPGTEREKPRNGRDPRTKSSSPAPRSSQRRLAPASPHSRSIVCHLCVCGLGVAQMQDLNADRYLKVADEFSDLAKTAPTPFMRAYFERVALRYRSSEGELKEVESAPVSGPSGA